MKNILTAVALVSALAAGSASATTVFNGSFESGAPATGIQNGNSFDNLATGPGSSWDVFTALNGWTTIDGPGIEVQTNRTLRSIDAHSGQHYIELDSHGRNANSAMTQSVDLAVGQYELSFWYSPRTNVAGENGIEWSIAGTSGTVSGPSTVPYTAVGLWTEITSVFSVGTAGAYDLTFGAFGSRNTYGGFLDSVSIAPVPLPASALLLLTCVGGLVAMRRRKTA